MNCAAFALASWLVFASVDTPAESSGWTRIPSPVDDPLHNGFFTDGAHGWIISYGTGVVLSTEDGGKIWSVAARLDSLYYESVFFLDPSNGWLCGERGALLGTVDGGKTWVPEHVADENTAFYGVYFRDARHAFLVGGNVADRRGVLLESSDGGLTWRSHPDSLPGIFYEPIAFVDERVGFIGDGRFVLRTTDGGATWSGVDIGDDVTIRGMHFLDRRRGWAVGHRGVVFRTEDAGLSWQRMPSFTPNRLRSVHFIDDGSGFIAGDADREPGSLWRTRDGGATWAKIEGGAPDMHRLFPGAGGLWAVGKSGVILEYDMGERSEGSP